MRSLLPAIFLLLLVPTLSSAQDAIDYALSSVPQDSLLSRVPRYNSVMLVPFDMTYYLSDADHGLAKYNRKTLKEIQQAFRYGLDGHLGAAVADLYTPRRILLDTVPEYNADLNRLRGAVSMRYMKPFGVDRVAERGMETSADTRPGHRIRKLFGKSDQDQAMSETGGDSQFRQGTIRGPVEGRKVMHARLNDTTVLQDMYDRYGTDLFLFVNQFELRTNYEHCLDRATNNFAREISVHYSIYNHRGDLLARDVITVLAESNTQLMKELMDDTFPALSRQISSGLPSPMMIRTQKANLR